MVPLKRRKVVNSGTLKAETHSSAVTEPTKFPQVLFLLERKMGASRRAFLSQLGRRRGFQVQEVFSDNVTHVICENNSGEEVRMWLESQEGGQAKCHLLDVSWYTESMRAGYPVEILDRHKLQELVINEFEVIPFSVPSYACQRRTTLENQNCVLTDALSLLAENAELSEEDGRGVAFRRAAAVLKALPSAVMSVSQLTDLPCLGEHSLRVIKDILKNGASSEVESTKESERFKALKVLTGIFGVGAKTADRWIREGIHNLQQLRDSGQMLNRAQQAGLKHYDDIKQPVSMAEADVIRDIVERAVASVLPGAQIVLTGGFRRGKLTGHDVDFLITHPEEGCEVGLMPKLVSWLESRGLLLYHKTTRNSYLESNEGPGRPPANIDRFERCLSIFKLSTGEQGSADTQDEAEHGVHSEKDAKSQSGELSQPLQTKAASERRWRALRVDLVVSPISQFAFALLGWSGSKLFERELRRWAGHERGMSLSSHALYDNKQGRYIRASSEEEIFAHLGLDYIPPSERNA